MAVLLMLYVEASRQVQLHFLWPFLPNGHCDGKNGSLAATPKVSPNCMRKKMFCKLLIVNLTIHSLFHWFGSPVNLKIVMGGIPSHLQLCNNDH